MPILGFPKDRAASPSVTIKRQVFTGALQRFTKPLGARDEGEGLSINFLEIQ